MARSGFGNQFLTKYISFVVVMAVAPLLALPATSPASTVRMHASTGGATHLRGTTGLLTGLVFPAGTETSYYFQYGPTTAYGAQTPTLSAGTGTAKVPVGQPVASLTPGTTYHFKLVATAGGVVFSGRDKTFLAGGAARTRLAFRLAKPAAANVFGAPFLLSGALTGLGNANQPIALQASPYPYLEPFANVGAPATTNSLGAFSFRIPNLATSTQLRVVSLGKLPLYSPVMTAQVAPSVVLHARRTRRTGFVRLYGVVSPAKAGTTVLFQLEKALRPSGDSESSTRYVTSASARLRRGGKTFSRFSAVVEVRKAGRYRAFVKLGKGAFVSGASNSVTLRNTAPTRGRRHKHKR
ncbi:MAG TPA: hypothetical protein VFY36_11025 [Solirubrobacteraceae bacterium]|nr:hypothetical protein [Solirubrobacteraceae bacterium]